MAQQRPTQMKPSPLAAFNPNKTHSEPERWICIYPAYLNAAKTRQEGRLVAKDKAVTNPSIMEIRDVLMSAGFQPLVENKRYPRERSQELEFRGRVRVQLRKDDGSPLLEKFPTRESVFLHLAEMIPQLKSRAAKSGQENVPETGAKKKPKKK